MRCGNRIDSGSMHARCYLQHGHKGVCRTYEGKPFTPTLVYEEKLAERMENALVPDKPQPAPPRSFMRFRNDNLGIALRERIRRL